MDIRREYSELQRIMGNGLQILAADSSAQTQVFTDALCNAGHTPIAFKETKIRQKRCIDEVNPNLPLIVASFPFENGPMEKPTVTQERRNVLSQFGSRKTENKESKGKLALNPGVPIIFLGNMGKEKVEKIARLYPDNPVWFLGKEYKKHQVVPKLSVDPYSDAIVIECAQHNQLSDDKQELHCFSRERNILMNTSIMELSIPKKQPRLSQNTASGDRARPTLQVPTIPPGAFSSSSPGGEFFGAMVMPTTFEPFGEPGIVPQVPASLFDSAMGAQGAQEPHRPRPFVPDPFLRPPSPRSPGKKGPSR